MGSYGMEMESLRKNIGPVEVLWDGYGYPLGRSCDQWKYYGMEMGYPIVDRHTPVKTVPSPSFQCGRKKSSVHQ